MTPEARAFFRQLIRTMSDFKTNLCIDAEGTIWALGPWYGGKHHFRCNFGHWSERVLGLSEPIAQTLEPWVNHKPPTDDDVAWSEYFTRSIE